MIFVGLVLGILIGVIITNFRVQEEKIANRKLEDDLDAANFRVEQRDNLIKNLKEKLDKSKEKIKDQENNIELLVNNLSEENKVLVSDYQSNN